ncbi:hypothetical protein MNBD_ALPHA02-2051 [hydrothermal vent metagenome]|uniref:Alginate export domain-containing protein n=1 Tax=hydrothermal vent metagenome TaxID=652676 RepID=A0A3B0STS0_9ZZZZ
MIKSGKNIFIPCIYLSAMIHALISPSIAQPSLEQRILELQHQSDILRQQNEALQQKLLELVTQLKHNREGNSNPAKIITPEAKREPVEQTSSSLVDKIGLGGQYRINSYYARNDIGKRHPVASRVRIRQNFDVNFSNRFQTHLQLELNHTSDNITTTSKSSRATNIDIRHAVLAYNFTNNIQAKVGIVPLSDQFDDILFSSDWDYNPVALTVSAPLGSGHLRAFAANLNEGMETVSDDFVHYQLDFEFPITNKANINLSSSLIKTVDFTGNSQNHINVGAAGSFNLGHELTVRGFIVGSFTDKELLGAGTNGKGFAAKIEVKSEKGFSLMATHASGSPDRRGFLPVMALARTNGYWGYTGILTIQGPTDTGIDGDAVNISNNGYGLTTFQLRYFHSVTEKFNLTLAAGWFGNSKTPMNRGSFVGTDFLAMGTYRLDEVLALDFGGAYAHLGDAVSGYWQGITMGTNFNGPAGETRNKITFFTRLQAEF